MHAEIAWIGERNNSPVQMNPGDVIFQSKIVKSVFWSDGCRPGIGTDPCQSSLTVIITCSGACGELTTEQAVAGLSIPLSLSLPQHEFTDHLAFVTTMLRVLHDVAIFILGVTLFCVHQPLEEILLLLYIDSYHPFVHDCCQIFPINL